MRSFLTKAAVLAVLILPCLAAPAQEIRSIRTLCEVYADGSADVSQIWNVNVVSGTEWYIPVGNLGKMTVEDLRVYENGKEFISEGRSWDTHRSLDEKAGRCGILEKGSDGVELCWGQGSYGDHEWLVTYHLTGLVQSLKDSDAFNYMFVNPGLVATPQYVNLIISNKTGGPAWTEENVHFWGFGFEGESWLEEDGIAFESDGRVESMIALVQFNKGLLSPTVERDIKFEKMRKKAFKGSSYAKGSGIDFETLLIILALLALLFIKDLGKTKTWIIFFILLAMELVLAVLTFDKNEVMSSIAGNLSRLVLDGTIGIAIREKYADKAARKARSNESK